MTGTVSMRDSRLLTDSEGSVASAPNHAQPGSHDTTITILTKAGGILSKHISLSPEGRVLSDNSNCKMWEGRANRAVANTAAEMAGHVGACPSNRAVLVGHLRDDILDNVLVITKPNLAENPNAIARTREFFSYRQGVAAWVLIDFDTKGIPPEISALIREAGGLWALLCKHVPGLAVAAHVVRASTSAGLYNVETNEKSPGGDGLHIYVKRLFRESSG